MVEVFDDLEEYFGWAHDMMDGVLHSKVGEIEGATGLDLEPQVISGKRFRPILTILCCQAVGGDPEAALPFASGIEMVHNGTLAHDDILDRDDKRRGMPSLAAKLGVGEAVMAGDLLFTKGFLSLVELDPSPEMVKDVIGAIRDVVMGSIREVAKPIPLEEPPLLDIAYQKTAKLFELACVCGGRAARCDRETSMALYNYGRNLGMSFQLADDLADLYESIKGKKEAGNLKHRHMSYPIFCLYISGPRLADAVQRWAAGRLELDSVLELLKADNSGIKLAKKKITSYHVRCMDALYHIPDSEYKKLLITVPKYVEMKMLEEVGALDEYLAVNENI